MIAIFKKKIINIEKRLTMAEIANRAAAVFLISLFSLTDRKKKESVPFL